VLLLAAMPNVEIAWRPEVTVWTFSDSSPSCAAAALLLSGALWGQDGE